MSREYCPNCRYPLQTCLCASVEEVHCTSQIHVMQHPSELHAAKNTVRLAQLCLPNLTIHVGEKPQDFAALQSLPPNNTVVLYPCDGAYPLESAPACIKTAQLNIIVLDGTWKKAHRLWMLNPWLTQCPAVGFSESRQSRYAIRQSGRANGLSSIEAIAYSLELIEGVKVQPLHNILQDFVRQYQSFQQ